MSNRFPSSDHPDEATKLAQLRWLVDFVQDIRIPRGGLPKEELGRVTNGLAGFLVALGSYGSTEWSKHGYYDDHALQRAIADIQEGLIRLTDRSVNRDAIFTGPDLHWPADCSLQIRMYLDHSGTRPKLAYKVTGPLHEELIWHAGQLLSLTLIRRCPICLRIFVPAGRQVYCARRCSQKERNRTYRGKHSVRKTKRQRERERYVRLKKRNPIKAKQLVTQKLVRRSNGTAPRV